MTNNQKHNHHFLPRLYLKGFSDQAEPSFIWVYERGKPYNPGQKPGKHNPYKRSIRLAGAEEGYYAYPLRNGEIDFETYENQLEQREKPANEIFTKLRQQQMITNNEKKIFASYIDLMIKRVPRHRERADVLWPEMVRNFERSSLILQQLDQIQSRLDPADMERAARVERLREQYHQVLAEYKQGTPKEILLGTIARKGRLPKVLAKMNWQFLVAPDGCDYVTSDNPVFFFEQLGLNKEHSEITFPISSRIALAATWNKSVREGFFPAVPLTVLEINRRTISTATKQVYYCRQSDWFWDILNHNHEEHSYNLLYPYIDPRSE